MLSFEPTTVAPLSPATMASSLSAGGNGEGRGACKGFNVKQFGFNVPDNLFKEKIVNDAYDDATANLASPTASVSSRGAPSCSGVGGGGGGGDAGISGAGSVLPTAFAQDRFRSSSSTSSIFRFPSLRCGMGAMDDAVDDVMEGVDDERSATAVAASTGFARCGGGGTGIFGGYRDDGTASSIALIRGASCSAPVPAATATVDEYDDDDPIQSFREEASREIESRDDRHRAHGNEYEDEDDFSRASWRTPPIAEICVQHDGHNVVGPDRRRRRVRSTTASEEDAAAAAAAAVGSSGPKVGDESAESPSQQTRSTASSTKLASSSSLTNNTASASYDPSGGELLFDLIVSREYDSVSELLKTAVGRDMAAVRHRHGDGIAHPLHLICDYERNFESGLDVAPDEAAAVRARGGVGVEGRDHYQHNRHRNNRHDNHRSKQSPPLMPVPPARVVIAILNAYPDAAKVRGYDGRIPLHHAARRRLPSEAVVALIRAHPQGLDVRDRQNLTPRDYAKHHYGRFIRDVMADDTSGSQGGDAVADGRTKGGEGVDSMIAEAFEWNALMERPSSCWMQQMRDEETQRRMDAELRELEQEVEELTGELDASLAEEKALVERLGNMESDLERYGAYRRGKGLRAVASKAEEVMVSELHAVTKRLDDVMDKMEMHYVENVQERKHVAEFSEDVKAVYDDLTGALDELETDLQTIKMCFM